MSKKHAFLPQEEQTAFHAMKFFSDPYGEIRMKKTLMPAILCAVADQAAACRKPVRRVLPSFRPLRPRDGATEASFHAGSGTILSVLSFQAKGLASGQSQALPCHQSL